MVRIFKNISYIFRIKFGTSKITNVRQLSDLGMQLKTWGQPTKLDNNTCFCCLQHPNEYNTEASLDFLPVMFQHIAQFGLSPMHKKCRCLECLWKLAEKKEMKTKGGTTKEIRNRWRKKFREAIGLRLFDPEPQTGGNSNTGGNAD